MSIIIVLVLVAALIWGGGTIAAGVFTGIITFLALAVIYAQLPKPVKRFIVFFRLVLDFAISGLVLAMLGGTTATALVGAVTCGLLVTLGLHSQVHVLKEQSMLVNDVERFMRTTGKL